MKEVYLVESLGFLKTWNTQLEAAKELGVNNATLHRAIKLGVSCPHKKYFWKYKD